MGILDVYLQRSNFNECINVGDQKFNEVFETIEQYVERINKEEVSDSLIEDINYHMYQLMEIYLDTAFIDKWLTNLNDFNKDLFYKKMTSSSQDLKKELYFENQNFISNEELKKKMDVWYDELFSFRYEDLKNKLNMQHFDSLTGTEKDEVLHIYVLSLMNVGLWLSLGLVITDQNKIFKCNDKMLGEVDFCDFLINPIKQYSKSEKNIKEHMLYYFFGNVSKQCIRNIILLWDQTQNFQKPIVGRINKENLYKGLSKEDLIKKLYEVYPNLPPHFFEILSNYEYENRGLLLTKDFELTKNNAFLVISYINYCSEEEKDWPLLAALFNKKHATIKNYKYDKDYEKNNLRPLDDFILTKEAEFYHS